MRIDQHRCVVVAGRRLHEEQERAERHVHADDDEDRRPDVPSPQTSGCAQRSAPGVHDRRGTARAVRRLPKPPEVSGECEALPMRPLADVVLFACGALLVAWVLDAAIRTFVLPTGIGRPPHADRVPGVRAVFDLPLHFAKTYEQRDRIMALYAPLSLLFLPAVWIVLVLFGYTLMFRAVDVAGFGDAFRTSGSSLLTLGFLEPRDLPGTALAFIGGRCRTRPARAVDRLPPDDLRDVLAPRGARRPDERAGRHPAVGREPAHAGASHRLAREPERPVVRVPALVQRGGGDPHVAQPPRVLPLTRAEPLVDHRGRRGARCRGAPPVDDRRPTRAAGRVADPGRVPRAAARRRVLRHRGRPRPGRRPIRSASSARSSTSSATGWPPPASRRRRSRSGVARLRGLAGQLRQARSSPWPGWSWHRTRCGRRTGRSRSAGRRCRRTRHRGWGR